MQFRRTLNLSISLSPWIFAFAIIIPPAEAQVYARIPVIRTEYQSKGPFGNAETIRFRNAINGNTPLTPEEEAELATELPQSEANRFYGRFSVNFGWRFLSQISNKSLSSSVYASAAVVPTRIDRSQTGLELAIGYNWEKDFRAELELLINRNLNFTTFPILTSAPARTLTGDVQNYTLLGNVYYDFSGFDRFRPYVFLGIGAGSNDVRAILTPAPIDGGQNSKTMISIAWNLGAGFRVSFLTRWFIDIKYRFTHLGVAKFQPNNNFRLNANYTISAFSIGLIYLF